MRAAAFVLAGFAAGAAAGAAVSVLGRESGASEPVATVGNGILRGWDVTRDNEVLLCEDPVVFIRAKQIECP